MRVSSGETAVPGRHGRTVPHLTSYTVTYSSDMGRGLGVNTRVWTETSTTTGRSELPKGYSNLSLTQAIIERPIKIKGGFSEKDAVTNFYKRQQKKNSARNVLGENFQCCYPDHVPS